MSEVPSGKLSPEALVRSVLKYSGADRPEVLIGPNVGEDAAVIAWPAGKFLVFSSDPIVGAGKGAGKLLVRVNANDIASKGADPAYLAVTLILHPSQGEAAAAAIMREIHEECRRMGIAVAGGHTEFNDHYEWPVVMGALIGTADRVLAASSIEPQDEILITKHVGIEGMSILAADRPDLLAKVLSGDEIAEIASWSELTSVLEESRVVRDRVKFMHDPTEGGFWGGVAEMANLCSLRARIDESAIPVHPITRHAARSLGFDPLHLIASGALLIVASPNESSGIVADLARIGIACVRVGSMVEGAEGDFAHRPAKEELWGLLKKKTDGVAS